MTSKRIRLLLVAIAAFVGVYSYTWFYAANKVESIILQWVENLNSGPMLVENGPISIHGFPFHISIHVDGVYAESQKIPLFVSVEGPVQIMGSIFNPTKLQLTTDYPVLISKGSKNSIKDETISLIKAEKAVVNMSFSRQSLVGDTIKSDVLLPDTTEVYLLKGTSKIWDAEIDRVSLRYKHSPQDPFLNDYTIDFEQVDFKKRFISSLPETIENIHLEFSLKGKRDVDLPLEDFMRQWYETGGMIDISQFIVSWGSIKVAGSGSLSLDDALQPVASLSSEIIGLHQALSVMETQSLLSQSLHQVLLLVLKPYQEERPRISGIGKEIYHKIAIGVQNNGIENDFIIGTVPIFSFPSIDWKELSLNAIKIKES